MVFGCKSKESTLKTAEYGQVTGKSWASYEQVDEVTESKKKAVKTEGMRLIKVTTRTTEYDTDKNVPIKTTEREELYIESNKGESDEVELKDINTVVNDSTHHIADASKMIEISVEEESEGGQSAFGKWMGIVIGIGIIVGFTLMTIKKRVR